MQRDSRILSEVITMQQTMDRMKGFHNSLLKITDSEQYIRDIFYLQLLTSVREWVHLSSMRCPGCLLRVIEEKTEENRNPEEKILKKQFHSVFGIVKESWKKYDAKEGEKFGL